MSFPAERPVSLSRRRLLFGRVAPLPAEVYPPWARNVVEHCVGCGDCVSDCPNNILKLNDARLPVVDFSANECSFCQACVNACGEDVYDLEAPPWVLDVSFSEACFLENKVYCRTCGDNCPEGAIQYFLKPGNLTALTLDNNICTGCGACVTSCPASAVHIQPEQTQWNPT